MRRWLARLASLATIATLALSLSGPGPVWPAAPARAQEGQPTAVRKSRLDALFTALGKSAGDAEAQEIVREIWETWMQSGRDDVDLLMQQVAVGMQSRNYGVATLLLDEVVGMAPDFAEGWNRRATLRFMMGDYAGSEEDIVKVLALEPRHFGALSGRAMIHMAGKRWPEALAAYRAALAVNPFLPERTRVLPELERRIAEGRL